MINAYFLKKVRQEIIGLNTKVPLITGNHTKYINFDNAASTPSFKRVYYKIKNFLDWYSNVHRGTGFKSQLSTEIYEEVHHLVTQFVGANPKDNTVILVKNTTEAINKLANSLNLSKEDIIITTLMEHHSNILPWRDKAEVIYINLDKDGYLDLNDLEDKLKTYRSKVKLVTVSGASNVTGYINPIHKIAKLVHNYNSKLLVDAAQLIPHRPINMMDNQEAKHIDYLTFSAHKMYAPFGTGVLIGPKDSFKNIRPDYSGGGTVKAVTKDDVIWADLPNKEEAGTPNIIGAVALGASIKEIQNLGWPDLIKNEEYLTKYTLKELQKIDNIELYGKMKSKTSLDQVGVIPFNIKGVPHSLTAAILANEAGIGVRNGCFCAHLYLQHLLELGQEDINQFKSNIIKGDQSQKPGLVRMSFGCYNTPSEVDKLIEALKKITLLNSQGTDLTTNYTLNPKTGEYKSKTNINYRQYFRL